MPVFERPILLRSTPNTLDPLCMRTQAEDLAGGQGADAAQLGEVVEATLTVEILGRVVRPNAESVALIA